MIVERLVGELPDCQVAKLRPKSIERNLAIVPDERRAVACRLTKQR